MPEPQHAGEPPGQPLAKRPWSRWWLLVPLLLVALRAALPEIVRRAVESNASASIHGDVTVGDVDLSLLRGHVDLKEVAIRAARPDSKPGAADATRTDATASTPLISIARLGLGLRYPPLLRRTVLLRALEIEAPRVELERLVSGDINLLGLLPVAEEPEQPGEATEPSSWKFGLDRVELSDGNLRFRDAMMGDDAEPIELHVGRIAIDDLAISPDVYGGPSRIHAVVALENGTVDVDGTLRMVDGEPALAAKAVARGLPLRQARVYVPEVGWSNLSGALDLDLDYELDPGTKNLLRGRAALADVSVAVPGDDVAAAFKSFVVELDALDLRAQDAKVKSVALDGAVVSVRLDDDEMLPVLSSRSKSASAAGSQPARAKGGPPATSPSPGAGATAALAEPSPSPSPESTARGTATPAATAAPAPDASPRSASSKAGVPSSKPRNPAAEAPAKPWTWRVEEARISDSTVKLSEAGRPPVDVATTLEAGPLASDAATIAPVKLTLGVAKGSVVVDGRLRIADPAFGGRLAIDGVELAPLFAITDALPNDAVGAGTLRSDLAVAAGLPARDGEEAPADRLRVAGTVDVTGLRSSPTGPDAVRVGLGSLALRVARLDVPGVIGAPPQAGASIDGDLDVDLADASFERAGTAPLSVSAKSLQLGASALRVPARLASLAPPDAVSAADAVEGDLSLRAANLRVGMGGGSAEASARNVDIALADVFVPTSTGAPASSASASPSSAAGTSPAGAAGPAPASAGTADGSAPAPTAPDDSTPGAAPGPGTAPESPSAAADAPAAPGAAARTRLASIGRAPAASLARDLDDDSAEEAPAPVLLVASGSARVTPVAAVSRPSARAFVRAKPRAPARSTPRPVQRPASPDARRPGVAATKPVAPSSRLVSPRPARAAGSVPANAARFDAKIELRGFEATTAGGRELRAGADSIVLRLDDVVAPGVVADGAPSATLDALRASGVLEIASPRAARGDGAEFSFSANSVVVPASDVAMPGSLGGLPAGAPARPLQIGLGDVRLDVPAVRATRTLGGFVLPDVSLAGTPPTGAGIESARTATAAVSGGNRASGRKSARTPTSATAGAAGNAATSPATGPTPAAADVATPSGTPTPAASPALAKVAPATTTISATTAPNAAAPASTTTATTTATNAAAPASTTTATTTATTIATTTASTPFDLRADAIRISRGRIEILDRTLVPAVQTTVFPIELAARQVRIPGPSARPLELDMTLPGRGRVRIDGELAPGASVIRTNVDGLSMTPFNPYVVASSPYAISDGALTLASVAREKGSEWTVTNDVTLHRLKLAGTDGGSLFQQNFGMPLETALALLRDVRGDISLGVPFTVDESGGARVHLTSIVASALRQALMGAIFSPLKMLGSLVGAGGGGSGASAGAEGPVAIGFAPGGSATSEEGRAMIDRLGSLLASRPGLAVRLSTAPTEEDARMLREQSVVEAWKAEGPFKRLVSDRDQRDRILAWLDARARGESADLSKEDRAAFDRAVAERPAPAASALRALAEARLAAVETDLRDRGVTADRIVRDAIPAAPVAGAPSVATRIQPIGGAPVPVGPPAAAAGARAGTPES